MRAFWESLDRWMQGLAVLALVLLCIFLCLYFGQGKTVTPPREMKDPEGKVFVSYGDSLTDGAFWQAHVLEHFPFSHVDCGIGGSCVGGFRVNVYWSEERILGALGASPDLLTLLGGTNDYFSNTPIGDEEQFDKPVETKDVDTYLGAYSYLVERLLEGAPGLEIVVFTPPENFQSLSAAPQNEIGLTMQDYMEASRLLAEHYGLPLVDLSTLFTCEEDLVLYSWDGIHPNLEGSEKIAEALVENLRERWTETLPEGED